MKKYGILFSALLLLLFSVAIVFPSGSFKVSLDELFPQAEKAKHKRRAENNIPYFFIKKIPLLFKTNVYILKQRRIHFYALLLCFAFSACGKSSSNETLKEPEGNTIATENNKEQSNKKTLDSVGDSLYDPNTGTVT